MNKNILLNIIKEEIQKVLQEKQLQEIYGSSIKIGDTFTLNGGLGKFEKGEKVEVVDKTTYGNDIKIILQNEKGIKDDFLLDIDDDFEQLG